MTDTTPNAPEERPDPYIVVRATIRSEVYQEFSLEGLGLEEGFDLEALVKRLSSNPDEFLTEHAEHDVRELDVEFVEHRPNPAYGQDEALFVEHRPSPWTRHTKRVTA